MKTINRTAILSMALAALLAAAALLAGCAVGTPVRTSTSTTPVVVTESTNDQNPASTGITVSGQGSISVKPDMANIQFGVQTVNANTGKARTDNDAAMTKVISAIKSFGVADADIQSTNYSIYPQYDTDGLKVTGFTVNNTVSVKVKDLAKLGDIISAAVSAGANNSYGVIFDVSDRTGAYNQALAQAMEKAKARADLMAKELGVTLGRVMTVSESSYSPGPVFSAADKGMTAGAATTPMSGGQMDIPASVTVVYEIVK